MRLQYQTPRRWVPTHELIQSDATWRGSSTEFVVYVMVEPLTKSQTKDWTAEIVPSTPRLIEPKGPFPGTQSPSSLLSRVPQRAPKKEHKSLCVKKKEEERANENKHKQRRRRLTAKFLEELELRFRLVSGSSMELQNTVKEALNALYHHPDDAFRMQADRWLQDFQRTLDAWQVLVSVTSSLFGY